ncbi:MAG TPA: methyltransferase domain-containing protein [Candidatus Paceibacterota bacterium]|nr:methyltransferase domain-containing protein [Candidatus Paceibacterota bacterium]
MQRINDSFLKILNRQVPLHNKRILDIGCGDGERSADLAAECQFLVGIDPSPKCIARARERQISNAVFYRCSMETLPFRSRRFGVVLFALSLHHIKPQKMSKAIDRAISLTQNNGHIVFLEPASVGSLYEAEAYFDAWDGDEREQKRAAQEAIEKHPKLVLFQEMTDEVRFEFKSPKDFVASMEPKRNHEDIELFLNRYKYCLTAKRTISIFTVRQ